MLPAWAGDRAVIDVSSASTQGLFASYRAIPAELRSRGVRVAIDDFGIGYSSLAYLKQLPVSALKIDKAFLTGIPETRDAAIVAAVIAMGHALGLTVIAEGVETPEQMAFLREHRCDVCQGYLFSKPITAEEIGRFRRG